MKNTLTFSGTDAGDVSDIFYRYIFFQMLVDPFKHLFQTDFLDRRDLGIQDAAGAIRLRESVLCVRACYVGDLLCVYCCNGDGLLEESQDRRMTLKAIKIQFVFIFI